jgi:hypothetical protein
MSRVVVNGVDVTRTLDGIASALGIVSSWLDDALRAATSDDPDIDEAINCARVAQNELRACVKRVRAAFVEVSE